MRIAKVQISLCIRTVWSGPLLSAINTIGYKRMYKWRTKTRMSPCACAGWYEYFAYFAQTRRHCFAWRGLLWNTVGSPYLEDQGTLWNTSRYPYTRYIRFAQLRKKINRTTKFHKWICYLNPEVRDMKILRKRREISPLFYNILSLLLDYHVKTGQIFTSR